LTDSKTKLSLASTPTAPVASSAAPITDSGKSLKKTSDFSTRKQRAEKEDDESRGGTSSWTKERMLARMITI